MRVELVVTAILLVISRTGQAQEACAATQQAHEQDPKMAVAHKPQFVEHADHPTRNALSDAKDTLHFDLVVDSHGSVDSARSQITGTDDPKYVRTLWKMLKEWQFVPADSGACHVTSTLSIIFSPPRRGPAPRLPGTPLPNTRSADRDGSRFLAVQLRLTDSTYRYVSTKDLARDSQFVEVSPDSTHPGDIAWWAQFAALFYGKKDGNVLVYPMIRVPIDTLTVHFGPPRFFRRKAS